MNAAMREQMLPRKSAGWRTGAVLSELPAGSQCLGVRPLHGADARLRAATEGCGAPFGGGRGRVARAEADSLRE